MCLLIAQLDVQRWAKGFRCSFKLVLDLHLMHLFDLKNIREVIAVVKTNSAIGVIKVSGEMSSFTKN